MVFIVALRGIAFSWLRIDPRLAEMIDGPHTALHGLRVNHLLPIVGIDVEHVAQIPFDLLALRLGRLRMIVDPVLGPERLKYRLDRISPILERDTRKYGVGTFVVRCGAVDPGERCGGRCPVQERRHVTGAPKSTKLRFRSALSSLTRRRWEKPYGFNACSMSTAMPDRSTSAMNVGS